MLELHFRYVIFPIQVLAKSCKPVPVMLFGAIMGKVRARCFAASFTRVITIQFHHFNHFPFMFNVHSRNTMQENILMFV